MRPSYNLQKDGLFYSILDEICLTSRFKASNQYIQHGNTSVMMHSILVAYNCYRFAKRLHLPVHMPELIRGALLHDYFLYDWHIKGDRKGLHGFTHSKTALKNAQTDFQLTVKESDIIRKHMFPLTLLPPVFLESWLVCLLDKYCTTLEFFHVPLTFEKQLNL